MASKSLADSIREFIALYGPFTLAHNAAVSAITAQGRMTAARRAAIAAKLSHRTATLVALVNHGKALRTMLVGRGVNSHRLSRLLYSLTLDNGAGMGDVVKRWPRVKVWLQEIAEREPRAWTPLQLRILAALEKRPLTKYRLADAVCKSDEARLYKRGGLKELMAAGLVENHRGVGYFLPAKVATTK